ncbi:2914_t:CDS:2, partial [Racocetra fulgida]
MDEFTSLAENKQDSSQKNDDNLSLFKTIIRKDTYFVMSPKQLDRLKLVSEAVFKLANETLLEIINQNEVESWMESRYGIVKSLWKNGKTGINLIRIDFAWDQEKNFKVLELNSPHQVGWILSGLVEKEASADKIGIPLAPQPMFYANYVLKKLGPKVAIIILSPNAEYDLLASQIESLGGKAKIIYLSEVGFQDIIDFAPTGLFWRCLPGLIERSELIIKISNLRIPQIPSFEYTTGAIPKTYLLSKSDFTKNLNLLEQHKAVLKAGDSAGGKEVILGKNFKDSWEDKLKEIMNSNR